ncbi:DNA topoisomerase 1 [Plakobranchus ocellatus]|uniref:DNA topoisomerase I n=1 Tax=Plakobranchus ocellatus TaxID=259542 RepID=A0AAV3ZBY6_9GAST|nr:DNA topoisomerase 1 [Plakobranchus ocellatus]
MRLKSLPFFLRAIKAKKLKLDKKTTTEVKTSSPVKTESKAKKTKKEKEETSDEPPKKKKKGEEEQEVWRWWEEQREDTNIKWDFLEHKGPVFAPKYEPLPKNVRFYYDGKPMELTPDTEEVATFYGRMLDHDYTTRDVFNTNFMKDWRKVMTDEEKAKITDLKKCNFTEILDHFKKKSEERKNLSKEEKQAIKKENEEIVQIYGYCKIDKHVEKIGNFKIEPPSLFRGRGDHPKQGMLKKRVNPEDVIINCSKDSKIPEPPAGHKWKEVRHDNTVTWLASWTENIQGATKYVMLNAASKLKGEKDMKKYETARALHKCVDKIRATYQEDWKSKVMLVRQRAVALYFIDKLALRAGNEKEEGETADTVGCCSLRVEHLKLREEKGGKNYVVEFDFLGKDSIRYQNSIPVEKRVFKNLQLFMENKQPEDDLFDRLNTSILNKYLQELMEGLTAKVFRTYNASKTLSEQLELLTNGEDGVAAKMLSYNRANRAVAILCNHQRAVPKTFEKSMENLQNKVSFIRSANFPFSVGKNSVERP